jgi:8-oxo-dGTP pyrophosphatase MutT (NUDIX family)
VPEVYRQAASIVLFRFSGEIPEVLLLHKPRKRDSWQFPQGGMEEGEDVTKAALRELSEEAGIDNVTVLGESAEVYQYDFPVSYRRFRPDNVRGQQIRFVFALAPNSTTVRVDDREIDGFQWVLPRDIGRSIRRKQYLSLAMRLCNDGIKLLSQRVS